MGNSPDNRFVVFTRVEFSLPTRGIATIETVPQNVKDKSIFMEDIVLVFMYGDVLKKRERKRVGNKYYFERIELVVRVCYIELRYVCAEILHGNE